MATKWEKFIKALQIDYLQDLIVEGFRNTLILAIIGLLIGIVIGTLIAVVKVAPKYNIVMRILDKVCVFYVGLFRGTPMVVQLLLAYYVILPICGVKMSALAVGLLVFGMNSGAYVSEIMRGGINSVDKGQLEAARAVGLSYPTAMLKVVIPQAVKNILPTLGNEFITLIKETSVVSFIAVQDLYSAFLTAQNYTLDLMIPFLVLGMIYIVLVFGITLLIRLLERAFSKSDRRRA